MDAYSSSRILQFSFSIEGNNFQVPIPIIDGSNLDSIHSWFQCLHQYIMAYQWNDMLQLQAVYCSVMGDARGIIAQQANIREQLYALKSYYFPHSDYSKYRRELEEPRPRNESWTRFHERFRRTMNRANFCLESAALPAMSDREIIDIYTKILPQQVRLLMKTENIATFDQAKTLATKYIHAIDELGDFQSSNQAERIHFPRKSNNGPPSNGSNHHKSHNKTPQGNKWCSLHKLKRGMQRPEKQNSQNATK